MTEPHPSIVIPLCILAVFTVIANSVVCFLVYRSKSMRTFTNGFVVSLAISDIITGVALILQYSVRLDNFGLNVVVNIIFAIMLFGGIANLCAVTLDRYLAIMRPLHYTTLMSKNFWKILAGCWTCAIIVSAMPLCWKGNIKLLGHKIYVISTLFVCIILPYCLILVGQFFICQQIRRCINVERKLTYPSVLSNADAQNSTPLAKRRKSSGRDQARLSSEAKVAKVIVTVASLFVVSWFPVLYFSFFFTIGKLEYIPEVLFNISPFTLALGSLANPFLYSFMKPDFREQLYKMLRKRQRQGGLACLPMRLRSFSESDLPTDKETTV